MQKQLLGAVLQERCSKGFQKKILKNSQENTYVESHF